MIRNVISVVSWKKSYKLINMFSTSPSNIVTENGDTFIPASQRPDGTWRKARRVKEGYVPQEEVPLYESKGKQFKAKSDQVVLTTGETVKRIIPGLYIMDDSTEKKEKTKKKSKSKADDINKKMESMTLSEAPKPEAKQNQETSDPAKKLKNLKKRLREVEALEEKLKSGAIAKPEPDQLKKVQRKSELILQIDELEKQIG